jgi:hypothetical protein
MSDAPYLRYPDLNGPSAELLGAERRLAHLLAAPDWGVAAARCEATAIADHLDERCSERPDDELLLGTWAWAWEVADLLREREERLTRLRRTRYRGSEGGTLTRRDLLRQPERAARVRRELAYVRRRVPARLLPPRRPGQRAPRPPRRRTASA